MGGKQGWLRQAVREHRKGSGPEREGRRAPPWKRSTSSALPLNMKVCIICHAEATCLTPWLGVHQSYCNQAMPKSEAHVGACRR
jgi:hypothetical protein